MKKIVIVNGSPRLEGNCGYLCSQFAHAALQNGQNEVTRINLAEKNYRYYSDPLPEDDFDSTANLLEDADIIVLATPLFFYSMSGQLKVFIDRLLPYFSRLKNKEFYFILTAATPKKTMVSAIDSLTAFTDSLPDAKVMGVFCADNLKGHGDLRNHPVSDEIIQAVYASGNR